MKKTMIALAVLTMLTACVTDSAPPAAVDWNKVQEKKADAFNAGTHLSTDPRPTSEVKDGGIRKPDEAVRASESGGIVTLSR